MVVVALLVLLASAIFGNVPDPNSLVGKCVLLIIFGGLCVMLIGVIALFLKR